MEVKTYRAGCLRDALRLVRDDLGPDAAVLHTREVRGGVMRWMLGPKQIEVTASADVQVPSRLPQRKPKAIASPNGSNATASKPAAPAPAIATRSHQAVNSDATDWPDALFELFTELVEADFSDESARELIERVRRGLDDDQPRDARRLRRRLHRQIADEIETSGPIVVDPARTQLVALVGPTGVGKTTTIAKLAANFHLHERLRIGLITVDTYRIAAIDQLRTYAEIIDLPMEVASTPHELRTALQRMAGLDLILMDTAGRSPRDEAQLVELKRMLCEVNPDEIHLVLSSGASLANLKSTARRFSDIGATSLVLTKLDEAHALGNLLPLLRACRLPLSYLTTGQNVPDDIEVADADRVARAVLGNAYV
ncbi:MAG: hypothetical protein KDA38_11055 [Planctomycetales bacterium]|nr:hypothetical protein [Planctomycetales bacterium]